MTTGLAVTRVDDPRSIIRTFSVWPVEAGMDPVEEEPPLHHEHASDFPEHPGEVVDVVEVHELVTVANASRGQVRRNHFRRTKPCVAACSSEGLVGCSG